MGACRRELSQQAVSDVFVLTCDRMRRYEGSWHLEKKPLFPEYIFLESSDEKELEKGLRQYQEQMQASDRECQPIPFHEEEKRFLLSLCNDRHHIGMSKGYIQNGCTHVTEGPLQGKEELIRKIDRHKRTAMLELPGGEKRRMTAGLEIISKS